MSDISLFFVFFPILFFSTLRMQSQCGWDKTLFSFIKLQPLFYVFFDYVWLRASVWEYGLTFCRPPPVGDGV